MAGNVARPLGQHFRYPAQPVTMSDHDPFNEPETAHARARELMTEALFWDCTDESAPFGSDEGSDAYYEWRNWRTENPNAPLVQCFSWILIDRLDDYNPTLALDAQVAIDTANPDGAFLAGHYDIYTLDTTIIATGLGQLMDEGIIDLDAKQYICVAISRQRNPKAGHYDEATLDAIARVVDAA